MDTYFWLVFWLVWVHTVFMYMEFLANFFLTQDKNRKEKRKRTYLRFPCQYYCFTIRDLWLFLRLDASKNLSMSVDFKTNLLWLSGNYFVRLPVYSCKGRPVNSNSFTLYGMKGEFNKSGHKPQAFTSNSWCGLYITYV